jgi:uncharacterized RDD family membrane protein YckC
MKCPKCHYLSFEPEPRCRNCGYDLLESPPELSIKPMKEPEGPLADLDLHPPPPPAQPAARAASSAVAEGSAAASAAAAARGPWPPPVPELPLFIKAMPKADVETDEPLVKVPVAPRPPLGVRRPTPDPNRLRARYPRESDRSRHNAARARGLLDLEDPPDAPVASGDSRSASGSPMWQLPPPMPRIEVPARQQVESIPVGPVRRLEAAIIDGLFLGAINAALVWLTLQQCDLTLAQAASLPWLPFGAFLLLLNGGYLLMFTAANGQTVGKMAAHIRVVGAADQAAERVSVRQAALRAVLTIPSVLVLGLGFVPALLGDGRALHDRVAHTRVVRA